MDDVVSVYPPPVPAGQVVDTDVKDQLAALQSVVDGLVMESLDNEMEVSP